jgi:tripartite-type tricarboxylate transporter receptor subunit TctC
MTRTAGLLAALTFAFSCVFAVAQSGDPDKPIRILVGFSAGVAPDVTSRLFADKWNQTWAKGVAVENVTGAGGNFAVAQTAKAAPDGYTLAMGGNASLVINPNLMDKLGYDPLKDFTYITQVFIVPNLVVVPPDVPARDIKELIALAKAKPDYFVAGHAGIGTSQHLGAELFMSMTGVKIQQVPYRGTTQVLPDLLGGRLNLFFGNISNVLLSGLRCHGLVRADGAGWHAEADRRQDPRRDGEAAGAAGRARKARKPRPATGRQHAGPVCRACEAGNADVGQGHQGRRHQCGAIISAFAAGG